MQDGVLKASQLLFNVPVEPERALNPPQLSKRTALLRDRYVGQDPRRSRTVKGVTALSCKSVTLSPLNNTVPWTTQTRWTPVDSSMAGKVVRQSPTRFHKDQVNSVPKELRLDHSGYAPTHITGESPYSQDQKGALDGVGHKTGPQRVRL